MMGIRSLTRRLRALLAPRRAEQDLHDELAFHVDREAMKLIDQGIPPDEARSLARARFGSPVSTADACRDERGLTRMHDIVRDVRYALRTFRRTPLVTGTIVATVAVGLGVVAVLFTILNTVLFRVDAVPGVRELYAVDRQQLATGERAPFTRAEFDTLRRDVTVFSDVYAAWPDIDLHVDGRPMAVTLVSGNFFDVVDVRPALGRAFTALEDQPGGDPVVVLSDKGWSRRFARDPEVLGRTVLVGGRPFQVIGVMPAGFRGLQVTAPDVWAPLAQVGHFRPAHQGREDSVSVEVIGRLTQGLSMESARAQLDAWQVNRHGGTLERSAEAIVMLPRDGTVPRPMEAVAVFAPLFIVFGLILVIGCANVANLLLARGVARQREIGIRLSIGASRPRIIRQLMTESLLLAVAAAGGGYLISRLALESLVYWVMRTIPVDLGDVHLAVPAADWRVAAFLLVAALGSTAFFALLPALHATRIDVVRTMRGELVKEARPGRARQVLIGLQVFASALLLICAAIFLRSAVASARFDPGLRTTDTVVIDLVNEPRRSALLDAIAADPTIASYAAVRPNLLGQPHRARADTGRVASPVAYKFVSAAYFDVLDIPILRGRAFTPVEGDQHAVVIVSESVARALWPGGDGVGETFRLEPEGPPPAAQGGETPQPFRMVTVVGIARDVPGFRFSDVRDAGVFVATQPDAEGTSIVARLTGNLDLAREALVDRLTTVDPNLGLIFTLRTVARLETYFLHIAFWVSTLLGGLALCLTLSGLFSVLTYTVEQRAKEIGVRMALGASSRTVARLMLLQATRPVLVGLAAGAGLAGMLAAALLTTPFGAFITQIVDVTDPIAYLASVVIITVACLLAAWIPATRASRLNPVETLKQ